MRPTPELSQQTRGSTDRIIMKANNPPLLYKKILNYLFFLLFPLCLGLLGHDEKLGSLNFHI